MAATLPIPQVGDRVWDIDDEVDDPETWGKIEQVVSGPDICGTSEIWEVRMEGWKKDVDLGPEWDTMFIQWNGECWEVC